MAIEMPSDKVVDLFLRLGVKVLKFVHSRKFDDVKAIGKNAIWFSLKQMLTFIGRDVGDGSENITGMSCCTFDTVTVVDSSLARFGVNVKVL